MNAKNDQGKKPEPTKPETASSPKCVQLTRNSNGHFFGETMTADAAEKAGIPSDALREFVTDRAVGADATKKG